MADKEFKTKNGIIANGDITANGTLYLTLGSDAAGDIYTRAANGAFTRVAKGANNTLLIVNSTGGYTYATVNSALLANNSVANQHISGTNTIHGSVIVDNSIGATQLVAADIVGIVTDSPSITSNAIYDDQINPNHINTAAKFESTQFAQLRVNTASAVATAGANEDELVVENAANAGISILTPNTGTGKVTFGDSASGTRASVAYEHSSDRFLLTAAGAQKLTLNSTVMAVNGTIGMTLGSDATGDVYVRSSSGTLERVAKGANGTYFGVNSTSGYQFSTFTIGADSINPSMINTAATFENTSFQVVTAGELVISNTTPTIQLVETDAAYGTQAIQSGGAFSLETTNSTGGILNTFYRVFNDASGGYAQRFWTGAAQKLNINSSFMAVNNTLSVTGTGMFSSNLESNGTLRVIKATSGATAGSDEDEIIIENNANAGISILTPNTAVSKLAFGDPQNGDAGYIRYEHSGDSIVLGRAAQDRIIVNSTISMNGSANIEGILTVGELVISNIAPEIILTETDDSTGTRIVQSGGDLWFQTLNAIGGVIETSYRIITDATGASAHRWWVGADQKLDITGTTTSVNTDMDVAGTLDVNGSISSVENIDVTGSGPSVILTETDVATTHQKTSLTGGGGNFYIQTRNSANAYVTNDYVMAKNATGAIHHRFNAGGASRLEITNTSMDVFTAITVNGTANVAGDISITGNSGLGTPSPLAKLDVFDNAGTNDNAITAIFRGNNNPHQTNIQIRGKRAANPAATISTIAFFNDADDDDTYTEVSRLVFSGDGQIKINQGTSGGNTKLAIANSGSLQLPDYAEGTLQVNSTGYVIANSDIGGIQGGIADYTSHADTPKATTSGTTATFASIPSGVNEILVYLDVLSHSSGTAQIPYMRLGDAGGIEVSGYGTSLNSTTSAFPLTASTITSTDAYSGMIRLVRMTDIDPNLWVVIGWPYTNNVSQFGENHFNGRKVLSASLNQVQFLWSGGASFDLGTIALYYI